MSGHAQLWPLLVVTTWLCVLNAAAYSSYPSITLPGWRSNADYLASCDFDDEISPFCDWTAEGLTRRQTGPEKFYLVRDPVSPSAVSRLQSRFLYSSENSCLQFWYYKPHQDSSELRVSLSDDVLQTEIWSSLAAESHVWKQVLIPLSYSRLNGVQIVFDLPQGPGNKEEIVFDKIGVWRGQCGLRCQSGSEFWTDEATQCSCTDDQLTCSRITCRDGQPCRSTDSSGTCRVTSDLRYSTFDGVNFRFMGPCSYILTKVCDGVSVVPGFAVEVQKEQRSNSSVSLIQQVKVNLPGLRVTLLRSDRRRIMVNGIWRNLPLSLQGNKVKVSIQGPVVELQTSFNLSISYTSSGALKVTAPTQFTGKLCGMCGNFNHATDDDHRMVDGSLAQSTQALGESWQSEDPPCDEPIKPSLCSEAENLEYAGEAYCGVLLSHRGPFSECSAALGGLGFFGSCVFEMCSARGDPKTFCDVLQAFAKTCNEAGIPVIGWRNATYCPLACGAHSHFNACSSECPATCSKLDAPEDCGTCEERCECDDGFLLSGETCVPADDCGCWVDGQHYEKGKTFMQGDCERLCLCAGRGSVQCSTASCLAQEVCKVSNDVLGCFPSSPVTCSVYGDPHYITFDGKAYSFRGTCNYTVAKTCTASAASFALTARNEGRSNSSALNSVALEADGLHLVVRKNRLVYVNGAEVTLPYSHSTSVNVSQRGQYVQVDTDFGLRFLFNGNDRLFVQVDERHKGRMCGLCGTYSGSQFDDFLAPDGSIVPYPHDFASSWNTQDQDWTCSDGSRDTPECPPELDSEGFKECSKLFGDVFKACHWFVPPQIFVNSCVSDHCTSGGDPVQLCTSLQNYVAACEVSEVFLADWWKDTVCANIPTRPPTTNPTSPPTTPTNPPTTPTSPPTSPTSPPTTTSTRPPSTDSSTLTPSAPSCPWSCNFDQNECGWEQLIQDSFDWTRWSGSTPTSLTGPTSDHTTGSGYYMYTEADGVYRGDSARMMSPVCNALGTQCLTFWYHMYGWATAMAINVYKLDDSKATKLWSRINDQGNLWHQAQIEVISWGPFQIIVEGIRGSDVGSDVAWDDVTITYGKCGDLNLSLNPSPSTVDLPFITSALIPSMDSATQAQPISPSRQSVCRIDCDFENGLCAWDQVLTDVFDWTRHSGPTPTPMTGPSFDHTTGGGHYIYIEGDSATHGDTARLLSEECSDQQPQCLQFWYHMYGSSWTMGLTVYILHGNQAQEVWRQREDQGNVWHHALVDLKPQDNFKIIFEGRRGADDRSDVAVDDITLHRGTCQDLINNVTALPTPEPSQTTLEPVQTTPEPVQTTPEPVQTTPEPVQTTLEPVQTTPEPVQTTPEPVQTTPEPVQTTPEPVQTTLCAIQTTPEPVQTTPEPVQTTLEHVQTTPGPVQTTPEPVQTTFEHVQTTPEPVQTTPSPVQTTLEHVQTTPGPDQTTPEPVQTTLEHVQTTPKPVKTTPGPVQTAPEHEQTAPEHEQTTPGPVQTKPEPVQTTPGPVQTTPEPVQTTPEPVQTTTVHIPTAAPNFQTPTSSQPEKTSGGSNNYHPVCRIDCDFENGLCAWNQVLTDVFDWTRHSGSTPTPMTGPSFDHTTGSGHYIYIEGDSATHGDTARLLSEECSDQQPQCLQFWYHMYGSSWTMGLTVYLLHGNQAREVWRQREDQGNVWHRALVDLKPQDNFKIIFEGRIGDNARSDVAVDDISLHRGTCEDLINHVTAVPTPEGSTEGIPDSSTTTTTTPDITTSETPTEMPEPVQTTPKPVQTTAEPVQTTIKPVQTTPKPVQTTAEPVQTTIKPVQTTAEPVQTTAEPVQTTAEPVQTTAEPVQTTAKPVQTTAEPVQITAEPVQTTAEPVQTTAGPVQTTAEPVQTTAEPVQTTQKPVQTTLEPVQTTAEPVQTTTEPVHSTGSLDTLPSSTSTTVAPNTPTASTTTTAPQPTPSCPINSHYTACVPACQPTCQQLHGPPNCNSDESCEQGCVCDDGFVLKQNECVPVRECGCRDDDGNIRYFGETWYSARCTQRCECKEEGGQGELECRNKECDGDEVCLMSEQGEYSCKSADFSECSIDDDPEYRTFDNLKHKFKGRHSYVLVQTSDLPKNVPEVYIEGVNQNSREQGNGDEDHDSGDVERGHDDDDSSEEDDDDDDDDVGRLRALRIRVYNHTVEFREGRRVKVNGVQVRVPVFPTTGLKILERSSRVYLKTDFGLSVEFKGNGKAEISLPDTYKTKVGGLCGNFDSKRNNDMMKPDGQPVKNLKEFGESWRVVEEEPAVRRRRSSLLYALSGRRQ